MFYIQQDEKIVLFNENIEILKNTIAFMPQYADLPILETERPIINFEFADTDEYLSKIKKEELERVANLSLTAADVERGIYQAKGMDFDDIITFVEKLTNTIVDDTTGEIVQEGIDIDIKALKIELKANHFYRGNPYVEAVGALLGFTSEQLDKFFETNDYKKLIN